jgi:hypothetical protein
MRNSSSIATALTVFTCVAAAAAGMAKDEYKASRARIAAEYEAARQKCGAHLGNPAQLCVARARGAQKVALAELEATYKPGARTYYDAAIARSEAAYTIASKECDGLGRESRDACAKDARAARERAKAEAIAARKASVAEPPTRSPR